MSTEASGRQQCTEESTKSHKRRHPSFSISIPLEDQSLCRICYSDDRKERFITPCLCSGTLAGVHRSCIESWLTITKKTTCTICRHSFRTKQVYKPISQWEWPPMTEEDVLFTIMSFIAHITVMIQIISITYICLFRHHVKDSLLLAFAVSGICITLPWTLIFVVGASVALYASEYWEQWRNVNKRVKLVVTHVENVNQ